MTQKNLNEFLKASEMLKAYDSWSIFTHKKSDGDSMGSANALYEAGINLGKQVSWYAPDENLPAGYKFLPHFEDFIGRESFNFDDDKMLYVFLDCSNEFRSLSAAVYLSGRQADGPGFVHKPNVINIDHHEDNSMFGQVNCVDGKASSTCEMLYRLFKADNWNITQPIAESLYTGLFTDTGGFSFSNTSPLTHIVAAELIELGVKVDRMSDLIGQNKSPADFLIWSRAMSRVKLFGPENIFAVSVIYKSDFEETGADMTGTEGLSSMFMTIRGVKLISTITEYPNGDTRLSIRSREGSPFGAGELARDLGGGGHERAAGASFNDVPIEKAADELEAIIMRKYHECNITS